MNRHINIIKKNGYRILSGMISVLVIISFTSIGNLRVNAATTM